MSCSLCLVVVAHGPRAGQNSCRSTGTSWTKRGPRAGRSKPGSDPVTTVLARAAWPLLAIQQFRARSCDFARSGTPSLRSALHLLTEPASCAGGLHTLQRSLRETYSTFERVFELLSIIRPLARANAAQIARRLHAATQRTQAFPAFSTSWSLHRSARLAKSAFSRLHRIAQTRNLRIQSVRHPKNSKPTAPARSSNHSTVRARPRAMSLADSGHASACQGALDALPSISSHSSSTSDSPWRSTRTRCSPSLTIGERIVVLADASSWIACSTAAPPWLASTPSIVSA